MESPPGNKDVDKVAQARSERLKSALKANLARRKDQARRRTSGDQGDGGVGKDATKGEGR
jgi:hypothetical protein